MGELVTKGFIGGHSPTKGFYTSVNNRVEAFLSELEARVGLNPLIRLRFDLDGDGVYETVELDEVMNVGNIDRVIEYLTNKSRYGSCSADIRNIDNRWSDFNSKGFTFAAGPSLKRYHMKRCIVELGFDNFAKKNNDGWIPLFFGYINVKSEDASSKTVSITLLDEWNRIFNIPLYFEKPATEVFPLSPYNPTDVDARQLGFGLYFGKHTFLKEERYSQDNQLCIRLNHNEKESFFQGTTPVVVYPKCKLLQIPVDPYEIIGKHIDDKWPTNFEETYDANTNQIYIWGWNKDWFADGKAQWVRVPRWVRLIGLGGANLHREQFDILRITDPDEEVFKSMIYLYGHQQAGYPFLRFFTADGTQIDVTTGQYWDYTNSSFAFKAMLHCDIESNPVKNVYQVLTEYVGVAPNLINATGDWTSQEYDYDNVDYYSFDTSAYYVQQQGVKACINIKSAYTFQKLIEDVSELTRGSFFISKGISLTEDDQYIPVRRLNFVIHQPRFISNDKIKRLSEDRLSSPELSRDLLDVKNNISIGNFDYRIEALIGDTIVSSAVNQNSIDAYGEYIYSIVKNAKSNAMFLYDSQLYVDFLIQHYLLLYSEPITKLTFNTDLIGFNWDLKNLIAIQEREHLLLDYDSYRNIASGIFEVYGIKFDTRRFAVSFTCQWAGYLIAPEGDIANKRYAFCDDAICKDTDEPLTYHCW